MFFALQCTNLSNLKSFCILVHKLDFLPGLCYPVAVGRCVHMITAHKLKKRDLYLNRLIAFQDTEPVKIVTGSVS